MRVLGQLQLAAPTWRSAAPKAAGRTRRNGKAVDKSQNRPISILGIDCVACQFLALRITSDGARNDIPLLELQKLPIAPGKLGL